MKEIHWLSDTREILASFPEDVKKETGFALYCEQLKIPHSAVKPLKGFRYTVREIKSSFRGETYRTVYVVNIGDSLYVLHVFQKKSKKGISTPKPDMDLIRKRIKLAEEDAKEK